MNTFKFKNTFAALMLASPFAATAADISVSTSTNVQEQAGQVVISFSVNLQEDDTASLSYRTSFGVSPGSQADAGADFKSTSGTLRWNSTNTGEQTVTIAIADDREREDNEDFVLELSAVEETTTVNGARTEQVFITILDNDVIQGDGNEGTVSSEAANALNKLCPEVDAIEDKTANQVAIDTLCDVVEAAPQSVVNQVLRRISPATLAPILRIPNITISEQSNVIGNRMQMLRSAPAAQSRPSTSLSINDVDVPDDMIKALTGSGDAEADQSPFDAYVNGTISLADKDTTEFSTGFDSDGVNLVFGGDYQLKRNWYLGTAIGVSQLASNFDDKSGSLETTGTNLLLYSTYAYRSNTYIDAYISAGQSDLETKRVIDLTDTIGVIEIAKSDTSSTQTAFGMATGIDFTLGAKTNLSLFTKLDFVNTTVDGFTEMGSSQALKLGKREMNTQDWTLGTGLQYPISTRYGVFVPNVELSFVHNFSDERADVQGSFAAIESEVNIGSDGDETDQNYFNFAVGSSAAFANGILGFLEYRTVAANDNIQTHDFSAGVRYEF